MAKARRVLVISSFPPVICGVGQYAEAHARSLEAEGARVVRWNIAFELGASTAQPRPNAKLALLALEAARADEIFVHYQSSLYQDLRLRPRLFAHLLPHALLAATLAPHRAKTSTFVHELNSVVYPWANAKLQQAAAAALFRASGTLVFHTENERARFGAMYFTPKRSRIVPPGHFYRRRVDDDRAAARAKLGLHAAAPTFLCIGFFHPLKGFAEFAEAFSDAMKAGALPPHARLYVVTSLRPPAVPALARELQALVDKAQAGALTGVIVKNEYVDDVEFDRWLAAADWVAVPYRTGYTSSIAARAVLYGTPCILSSFGALSEQQGEHDVVYADRAQLDALLRKLGGQAAA